MNYLDKGISLIKTIKSHGFDAYLIGGCVRDFLLDLPSNDIDITTNMPIDKLKELFPFKDNGSNYLSITIKYQGTYFEITHFRKDISYVDHRHPNVEEANNLIDDIKRRDFTINALAFDSDKKILDYYNGISDLKNKLIRAIGDPKERFDEDALRILRALYFSSKLDFDIEKETLDAIIDKSHLLTHLSNDRIYEYFKKIVSEKNTKGIDYINQYDLFRYVPEFKDWLSAVSAGYEVEGLAFAYYAKYRKYPPIISAVDKKYCQALGELLDNRFDDYYLYKNKNYIYKLSKTIERLGYNEKELKGRINGFPISDDNDLALSKIEITSTFEGQMKSVVVRAVIKAILAKQIPNDRDAILKFLKGF